MTDVVITALKDYRYDVLTATINYLPDGDLFIKFHLEGISPEVDPKRPIHLNINSEQNVISLLRSLTYSGGLSESIDSKIRENFK